MKHRLLFAAAATALLAAPTLAHAQDSGVYIKGQAGYGVISDADLVAGPTSPNWLSGGVAGQGDLALALGLGYDFGENWRLELEGSQLYNDMGTVGGQPSSTAGLRVNSLMLNALYDFSDFGRWEPYVGVGVGLAQGDFNASATDFLNGAGNVLVRNPACVSGTVTMGVARSCNVNEKDTNFAWNILAGIGYNITDNLTWDTNYKYADLGDYNYDGTLTNANVGGIVSTPGLESRLEDVTSHTIMTGFRYRFGKATPPPVPVAPPPAPPETFICWDGATEVTDLNLCPAQTVTCWDGVTEVTDLALCPPQTFLCPDGVTNVSDLAACPVIQPTCGSQLRSDVIYYEFDRAQSAETRNAINRVLDVGQFCQITSISVVGHTDTSGSRAYNQRLSERRAADASAELSRQGVSSSMITSTGMGETQPAVDTGDGVREQRNRRTEILVTLSELGGVMMSN